MVLAPGEPGESRKPQPIGNMPLVFLITTCTICVLFLLWRRADAIRMVVSHRLKTFRSDEGHIRLSEEEGPPANDFLEDDFDDDNPSLTPADGEPLSEHIRSATRAWRQPAIVGDMNDAHHFLSTPHYS